MLETLEIKNYRSCANTQITFQKDLSVLIGPNGSGKTNILNAILLLRKLAEGRYAYTFEREESLDETKLNAVFTIGGSPIEMSSEIQIDTDDSNSDQILKARYRWVSKKITGTARPYQAPIPLVQSLSSRAADLSRPDFARMLYRSLASSHFDIENSDAVEMFPTELIEPILAISKNLAAMKYYSASQFTNPANCPVSFEVEQDGVASRGRRLVGHAKFLFDLYRVFKDQEQTAYSRYFDIIGPAGIGLITSIDFKEIQTSSIDYTVRSGGKVRQRKREKSLVIPQFTIGSNSLSPNQLSEGTFKTITLVFYLITELDSSLLLIEEPEVCVHHGLLASIVDLIKTFSKKKQIVVSTHSDLVLDKLEPRHVYKVSRDDDLGSVVSHVTKDMNPAELKALKHYLSTEGNLGEYWKHGGLD